MPTLVINDMTVESQIGERVLDVARREALHIGFVCDGKGLCQTCECRILNGGQHLSPPNDIEKVWLTEGQLEQGHRLACQASMRGPGPVEVLTRAEQLRREAMGILSPAEGTTVGEQAGQLINTVFASGTNHLSRWPGNMTYLLTKGLSSGAVSLDDLQTWAADTGRVANRLLGGRSAGATEQQPGRSTTE